jgi:hypothetical protein
MSIAKILRDFFASCPLLKDGIFNFDYLGVEPVEYTIETVPTEPVYKRYIDGSSIRQYPFVFASREFFGADVWSNIDTSAFYENLSTWVEIQSNLGSLPEFQDKYRISLSLEVTSSGYVFQEDADNARYQIQMVLKYYQDRRFTSI